ncbi:MAG: hypothetical protein AB1578_20110, partial [Thermodesulfobacteriota bacterium]
MTLRIRSRPAFLFEALLLFLALFGGFQQCLGGEEEEGCAQPVPEDQATILSGATVWSGEIRLEGTVVVAGGATLTVRPGTRVHFALPEPRADADPPPWLLVLGKLEAQGTAEQPVVFSPEHPRVNGTENMVEGRDGAELRLAHSRVDRGPGALHLHPTP